MVGLGVPDLQKEFAVGGRAVVDLDHAEHADPRRTSEYFSVVVESRVDDDVDVVIVRQNLPVIVTVPDVVGLWSTQIVTHVALPRCGLVEDRHS